LRAVLLSDENTAKWLSENFVLSWENVREPAKVSIDFGKGKKLERTLAGNTAFYLTTSDGTVVDVYPGVYTPADFRKIVQEGFALALDAQKLPLRDRERFIRDWHTAAFYEAYQAESAKTTGSKMFVESPLLMAMSLAGPEPPARPVETTVSKGSVEGPLIRSIGKSSAQTAVRGFSGKLDFEGFTSSLADISKSPATVEQARRRFPINDAMSEEEKQMQIIRLDSQTNVVSVRPAVHLMFRDAVKGTARPQDLTRIVYGQILHIDIDDPYLGLADNLLPGTPGG
jgi:hypothetical protein